MYSVPVRRILCIVFFELYVKLPYGQSNNADSGHLLILCLCSQCRISSNNEAVARQLHAEESAVLRRVLEDLNIDSAGFDSLVDVFRR